MNKKKTEEKKDFKLIKSNKQIRVRQCHYPGKKTTKDIKRDGSSKRSFMTKKNIKNSKHISIDIGNPSQNRWFGVVYWT